MSRLITGVLAAIALLAGAAPAADAATYRVYSCQMPDGRQAPLDGWTGGGIGGVIAAYNDCGAGGGFGALLQQEDTYPGDAGGWQFAAPAGLAVMRVDMRQTGVLRTSIGDYGGAEAYVGTFAGGYGAVGALRVCSGAAACSFGNVASGNHASNDTTHAVNAGTAVTAQVGCNGETSGGDYVECGAAQINADRAELRVYRATIELRDLAAPVFQNLTGSFRSAGGVSGPATVAFSVTDSGVGVSEVVASVGATEVGRSNTGGSCTDVGANPSDPYEYTLVKPCAAQRDINLTLDKSKIPAGPQQLRVVARDGAGNQTVVVDEQTVINPVVQPTPTPTPGEPTPAPDGSLSSGGGGPAGLSGSTLVLDPASRGELRVAYATARTISGTLVDVGKAPIAGAVVRVSERLRLGGAAWVPTGSAVTDAKGRFSFTLVPTGSRLVRLTAGESSVEAKVGVLAKMQLSASKSIRRRGTLKMSGKVIVDQLPKRGVRVEIQSRWGKAWRTIDSVQTSKAGAWQWKYRVERATGSLPFRAVLVPTSDVAAVGGTSKTVKVRVR